MNRLMFLSKNSLQKNISLCCILLFISILSFGQTQPNIVIIFSDDLGYGSVGAFGAPNNLVQTPTIDSLAKEGKKFLNAFTPASLCSPSRYGLLTGQYFWRDVKDWGILQAGDTLSISRGKPNLASRLKDNGYNTACIGKWHLGNGPQGRGPEDIGFDYFHDYSWGIDESNQSKTAEFTDEKTSDWIGSQSVDTPFFLYFAPIAVHSPFIPGIEYQGSSGAGVYGDYINELDGSVENILKALDQNGFTDNTIIIFTSDNGAGPGAAKDNGAGDLKVNGDYRGTKLSIFDGGFRVPLIIKWPAYIQSGTTSNINVNIVDIYASIMEMLGVEMKAPTEEAADSYSFYRAWFSDENLPDRKNMILTNYEGIAAIHTDGWKYIDGTPREPEPYTFFNTFRQQQEGHEQLYHIASDPYESNDLVNVETAKTSELKSLLIDITEQQYTRPDIEIEKNAYPIIKNPIQDIVLIEGFSSITLDISNVFLDSDSDELSFVWTVEDKSIVDVTESNGKLTLSEGNLTGETHIKISANDGKGGVILENFLVTIMKKLTLFSTQVLEQIQLYPNPVSDGNLYLELTNSYKGKATLILSDLTGKSIFSKEVIKFNNFLGFHLNTANIRNGTYILLVNAGKKITRKVIIDK